MFSCLRNDSMNKIFAIACVVIILSACNPQTNKNTTNAMSNDSTKSAQANNEWMSLFDGKTTKGWHKYGGGPVGSAWKVADRILSLDAIQQGNGKIKNGGDIVTD